MAQTRGLLKVAALAMAVALSPMVKAQAQDVVASTTGSESRKNADATVDRNILIPTAETLSAGDFAFNSYELFLAGFTYGITDQVQASLTTMLPIVTDIPLLLNGSVKWQLINNGRLLFSIMPSASMVHQEDVTGGTLGLSFLLDVLLDDDGDHVLTFGESNLWAWGGGSDSELEVLDGVVFALSASGSFRVHQWIKLMIEFVLPGGAVNDQFELVEEALIVNYGIRFFFKAVSVDLSFIRFLHPDMQEPMEYLPMGVPYVTFSARF